jgi:hypothetical protein
MELYPALFQHAFWRRPIRGILSFPILMLLALCLPKEQSTLAFWFPTLISQHKSWRNVVLN